MDWHSLSTKRLFEVLKTEKSGLTNEEAAKRLKRYGFNELERTKKISPLKIFISQFKSILVLVLVAAVIISIFLGPKHYVEAGVIGAVLMLMGIMGFVQEYKAEKTIEALQKMNQHGGKLFLTNLNQTVRGVFEIARLDGVFNIVDTEESALAKI